jgi:hypothetical protein
MRMRRTTTMLMAHASAANALQGELQAPHETLLYYARILATS